ncbi:hypothetical protein ACXGQP_05360 [Enterobacter oligotrophicus]
MQKELQNKWALSSFYILLFFIIVSLASIAKQLLMHYQVIGGGNSVFILSLVIAAAITFVSARKANAWILLPLLMIGISLLQASIYPDHSWDGLAYHQKAAWYLMHSGNLLFDGDAGNFWIALYPKSTWYFAGEAGLQFGSLAYGSAYQLMIGFSAYAYTIYFFGKNGYSLVAGHIFAVLSLLSPIFIAQSFSYYVDATMGFLALLMMLSSLEYGNTRRWFDAAVLIMASIIIVNIKFSGFLYVGVCFLILGLRSLPRVKETVTVCVIFIAFLIAGVGVIGANPYVKNLVSGKHIFYPLFGESKKDIITFAQPPSFHDMNRFEKLAVATFSQSENINEASKRDPQLKVPGIISANELSQLSFEDLRIAGFGPLYSFALILAFGFIIYRRGIDRNCLILLGMIGLSTILNPEAWWARYAPHLYTILLLPLISIKKDEDGLGKVFIGAIIGVVIVNALMMAKARYETSSSFNAGLNWISGSCKDKTLHLSPFNTFLIEPMAQRGGEKYFIDDKPSGDAKDYRRKFYYWCE